MELNSAQEDNPSAAITIRATKRQRSSQPMSSPYTSVAQTIILCLGFSLPVKMRLDSMGTKVRATSKAAVRATPMARPKSRMNRPIWEPGIKIKLTNTTMVVAVEASTANPTSRLPEMAASRASRPFSCLWRKIFSSTTTLLSTSIPTATMSPIRETTFRLMSEPAKTLSRYMKANVKTMDTGMAMEIMRVLRNFPKKKKSTPMAKTPP